MTAAARKQQIVDVTLRLVAEHGVEGTTTSRIAAAAGVSEATLYRHFASRSEILIAALDHVYDDIFEVLNSSAQPNVPERLRDISRFHSGLVSSDTTGFVYPLFEFVAAPQNVGLREPLAQRQLIATEALARIVEEGKVQGTIRPEVDSDQVAWELVGVYWAEDIAYLMGLGHFVTGGRSGKMLERILESITVPHGRPQR
jgi:AcrR family transcriptional regulator